jgi:hypothetical protein
MAGDQIPDEYPLFLFIFEIPALRSEIEDISRLLHFFPETLEATGYLGYDWIDESTTKEPLVTY